MAVRLQPVTLGGGTPDAEGRLVFRNDRLVAVLARLSSMHDDHQGKWFIETVFGEQPEPPGHLLADLDAAVAWADQLPG